MLNDCDKCICASVLCLSNALTLWDSLNKWKFSRGFYFCKFRELNQKRKNKNKQNISLLSSMNKKVCTTNARKYNSEYAKCVCKLSNLEDLSMHLRQSEWWSQHAMEIHIPANISIRRIFCYLMMYTYIFLTYKLKEMGLCAISKWLSIPKVCWDLLFGDNDKLSQH